MAGSDDSFTMWLNGAKLFEDLRDKGWNADQYRFRGRLKAGRNVILVKCGNNGGGWDFSVAIPTSRQGALFEAVPKKLDPKAYAEFARANAGDPVRGAALFADAKGVACIKCHKAGGEGGLVGPDLKGVASKYAKEHFIESLLYPSKQILDGYKQTKVLTKSGDVKSGRFLGETAEELMLMDAEGRTIAIRKGEVERRQESELSMMPEGLNAGLSLKDFADVVGFLGTLK
jgi:putative heme-binding domain-containing protein